MRGMRKPQVVGRAVPVSSERGLAARKHSIGVQFTVSEQQVDFGTWVPDNAVYQARCLSATMYNSIGYLRSDGLREVAPNPLFRPLQLHTSHLRRSKYPLSTVLRDKQEDQVRVKTSRTKHGQLRTRVEFFTMSASEQQSADSVLTKDKQVHHLLTTDSEREESSPKHVMYHDVGHIDGHHQQQPYSGRLLSGRLLSGRMESGSGQGTADDLLQLVIGKQLADRDNHTQLVSRCNGKSKTKKRPYRVEKQDNTQSIPSKLTSRSNLHDLQIQPSGSSSVALLHQDAAPESTSSSSFDKQCHVQSDSNSGKKLKHWRSRDGMLRKSKLTTKHSPQGQNEVVVNCPTVINRALLATPHRSHGNADEAERTIHAAVANQRHSYPSLWKNKNSDGRKTAKLNPQTNPHSRLGTQLNQILLNSHTERFLPPTAKQHERGRLPHVLADRNEIEDSSVSYRATLSTHHQAKDSSRCMVRSHQRRKDQLQKNILGNSSGKRAEQNSDSAVKVQKKAAQPMKVCLRGTKKKLIDLLRANSSSSTVSDNTSSELPELYAE